MRRALFLLFILVLLIGGGLLSNAISQRGAAVIPGLQMQTNNPAASVLSVTPDKGAWMFIVVNVVLGSVIGFAVTIAVVIWFLNRQINRTNALPNQEFEYTLNAATPNSLGGVLTHRPAITISVAIVAIIALAMLVAVAFGAFGPK